MQPKQLLKKLKITHFHKAVSVVLALVFIFSAVATGTLAWSSLSQGATNPDEGVTVSVELLKLCEDTQEPLLGAVFALYMRNDQGDYEQILNQTFTTDDNGRVTVTNLKPGYYFFREITPPNGFTFIDYNGNPITRHHFTIPYDLDSNNINEHGIYLTITVYNRRLTGDLIIQKFVQNDDGSPLTQQQREQEFEFTVVFSNLPNEPVEILINREPETLSNTNYVFVFMLSHGQSVVFENIPTDVEYIVTETPTAGFSVNSTNHQGTIVVGENGSHAEFTNRFVGGSDDEFGNLLVTKTVPTDSDTEFTFTLILGDDEPYIFTLRSGEERLFENIPVGTPWTVTETPADGYTSSVLEFTGVITERGAEILLPFVNVWNEELEDEYGSLRVSKEVPGGSNTEFDFTVTFSGLPSEPVEILINSAVVMLSDTNYAFDFTLASGDYILFENIPHGVVWSVLEHETYGYTASIITANGIIAGNTETVVNFVNLVVPQQPEDVEISITKIVDGNIPNPNQRFYFVLEVYGQEPIEFYLLAGQTITFTVPASVMYTIRELIADGFSLINVEYGHGTTRYGILAEFTNRYDGGLYIDIEGEKTWINPDNLELPDYIIVRLMNRDVVVGEVEVRPDEVGEWHFIFENLPKYDADGNEIVYSVFEVPVDGWLASYCECCGFNVVNTSLPPQNSSISVEKIIVGDTPSVDAEFQFVLTGLNGAPMPNDVSGNTATITITGEGIGEFGDITFRRPGTFVYTLHEVNTGQSGFTYDTATWTITFVLAINDDGELYVQSKTYARNGITVDGEIATFTNQFETDSTEVRVTKVWNDNNYVNRPTSVQAQLLRNGVAYGQPINLNTANGWTYLWTGLEVGPTWTVYELNIPTGYTKAITGDVVNGWIITNTRDSHIPPPTTEVSVNKVWDDNNNPNRPTSVQVQLLRNGAAHGDLVKLNAANNWHFTWTGLEVGPTWTVYEPNVPTGYTKSISGDVTRGFTITNRLETTAPPGTVSVQGRKYWNHLNNPIQYRPTSITVFIYANGERLKSFLLDEDCHWQFEFELPRYDANGNEIAYTVNEARVYDYTKRIDGWNIHNRFHPGTHTDRPYIPYAPNRPDSPGGDSPATGDNSKIVLWIVVMLGSASTLVTMTAISKNHKRKNKLAYEGQYLK